MNMARLVVVSLACLIVIALFMRQIVDQMRSGKVRPRGSKVYKTREDNPVYFWSSIGLEMLLILLALYLWSLRVFGTVN
jgi:hypothetical protein